MKVVVCVGSNCTMMGADSIIASLENLKDTLLQKEGANPAFYFGN
jgi:NADH:ubiquinone oxidoreductase subunit E